MATLKILTADLATAGVKGEVWIDGSFLTEKINPGDVDLVVLVDTTATAHSQSVITALDKVTKQAYKIPGRCDSYEESTGSTRMRNYWIKQFGYSRGRDVKGIAVVTL